ncbi:MAG TPA: hypothetical protein VFP58_12875 [Candidatus Eisenbacteria bacterium]|nr:hypothetical protein [Candidatus Eisenbacteria bacterium]
MGVLLGAWLFLAKEQEIAGEWGYALDDSWIYAQMARNLATGHGFAFNPDEPVAGSTGPLYTFILALLYLVFHEVIWTAKVFGILCQIGTGLAIFSAMLALFPARRLLGALAALLVVTSPPLLWGMLSGMEIPLYLLLASVGLAFYVRSRHLLAVLVWGLGVWVRPDGLFLLALGLVAPPREALRRLAVAAPILVAFLGFNFAVGYTWMPQTVGMKAHFGVDLVDRTWSMMREWGALWGVPYRRTDQLDEPVVFLVLLLAGAVLTIRRWPLLAAYAIGFPIAMSLFRDQSGSHKRYILYVIPFAMILAVYAIDFISRRWAAAKATWVAPAAVAACLVWQAAYIPPKADTYGWNVQNINKMQRLLGEFVKLVTKPGDAVAANDIGAIGYFGERYVVDLLALISPPRSLRENLEVHEPKLLLIFLTWFESDAVPDPKSGNFLFYDADSSHRYELLAGIELKKNTICANSRMTAYVRLGPGEPSPARRYLYQF